MKKKKYFLFQFVQICTGKDGKCHPPSRTKFAGASVDGRGTGTLVRKCKECGNELVEEWTPAMLAR